MSRCDTEAVFISRELKVLRVVSLTVMGVLEITRSSSYDAIHDQMSMY